MDAFVSHNQICKEIIKENTGSCNHIQASISACVREGYLELPEEGTSEITKNVFTKYFLKNLKDEETEKWSDLLQNVALIQCLARAYDFENSKAERDPELAIAMYESLVGKSAEATNNLALLYLKTRVEGKKLKKDCDRARELLETAANMNNFDGTEKYPLAYLNLGYEYLTGENFEQDYNKAKEYFEKGASLGQSDCRQNLAAMYEDKLIGEDRAASIAFEMYQKAANEGQPWGKFGLARCFENGLGVEKDPDEAEKIRHSVQIITIDQFLNMFSS